MASESVELHKDDLTGCDAPEPSGLVADAEVSGDIGVPAANFVRSFSKWRDEALVKPVFVKNHGRITHALVAIDQFVQMNEDRDGRKADDNPFELAEWIDEAIIICDRDLVVESMNRVASAACRMSASQCVGRNLYECLPQLRGTLFDVHLMRTVQANESTSADIPSPLREDGWLRLQSFPLHERNVLMFRDITEEVETKRELVRMWRSVSGNRDWAHYVLGMNAANCRYLSTSEPAYAETFFVVPIEEYLELCRLYFSRSPGDIYYSELYRTESSPA